MTNQIVIPANNAPWLGESFDWDGHQYEHVASQFEDHSRWSVDFLEIYRRDDGTLWGAYNCVPATECQEFESEDVELIPVVEIPAVVYVSVD